jgi:toxin ParE1/3/4
MQHAFHPAAMQEYFDAAVYYESCRTGLGDIFIERVEDAIAQILDAPVRWSKIEDDVRRCLTRKFPYAILYTVEFDSIFILAVMHCSRAPGYWRSRRG